MQLDKRLNKCTRNLNGGKLLAILRSSDVVAQELKHHCSCLKCLYYKEEIYFLTNEAEKDDLTS
jgi:hypothetical protein